MKRKPPKKHGWHPYSAAEKKAYAALKRAERERKEPRSAAPRDSKLARPSHLYRSF